MVNNLKFYSRDSNSYRHEKFVYLRMHYGWEGDAKFWALNDMIAEADGCVLDLSVRRTKLKIMGHLEFKNMAELDEFLEFLASEDCDLIIRTEDGGITTDRVQETLSLTNGDRINLRERQKRYRERKKAEKVTPEEKQTEVPVTVQPDLQEAYKALHKSKQEIASFIKTNRPTFAEPYVDAWNIWATENGQPTVKPTIPAYRRKKIAARAREPQFDFIEILRMANKSKFLLEGKFFRFDWIVGSPTNYIKVLEGNYTDKEDAKQEEKNTGSKFDKFLKP